MCDSEVLQDCLPILIDVCVCERVQWVSPLAEHVLQSGNSSKISLMSNTQLNQLQDVLT